MQILFDIASLTFVSWNPGMWLFEQYFLWENANQNHRLDTRSFQRGFCILIVDGLFQVWHLKFLRICTIWSRRLLPFVSIWRGTERTRTPSLGWFWLRAGSTDLPVTTRRPRSSLPSGNSKPSFLCLFDFLVLDFICELSLVNRLLSSFWNVLFFFATQC